MRRSVLTAGRLLQESSGSGGRWLMVTLTYDLSRGEWSKKHIAEYWHRVRAWANRKNMPLRYVWVAELTKKGTLHYHCLVWVRNGCYLPRSDSRGWWKHGTTNTMPAKSALGYLAKYCSKGSCGVYPKGARISGNGGLERATRGVLRWWLFPRYVREVFAVVDDARKVCGGYVSRETGEFLRSCWAFGGSVPGFVRLVRIS